jgi:two-component system sensor histidine kinase/response regulator
MFAVRRNLRAEQVLKRSPWDIFDDETATLIEEQDYRVAETRTLGIPEFSIEGGNDVPYDYLTIKLPIIDDDENVSSIVSLDIDMTEQKRNEPELRKLKETG